MNALTSSPAPLEHPKPSPANSRESHVVTLTLCFGSCPIGEIHELFRGTERECARFACRVTTCSDDRRYVSSMMVTWGPIADWENYTEKLKR